MSSEYVYTPFRYTPHSLRTKLHVLELRAAIIPGANFNGFLKILGLVGINLSEYFTINSLHPRVRKHNFPCNDDNVAFMQQVHSKITGKQSDLLIV